MTVWLVFNIVFAAALMGLRDRARRVLQSQ